MTIQVSDLLDLAIRGLARNAGRRDLGEQVRETLVDVSERLGDYRARLRELEGFVALPVREDEADFADCTGMPADRAVMASVILGAIWRAGVNVSSLEWFDAAQRRLALAIAAEYRAVSHVLKAFRASRKRDDEFSLLVNDPDGLKTFIDILESHGVVAIKVVLFKPKNGNGTDQKWSAFSYRQYPFSASHDYLVIYRVENSTLNHMVYGDWMTCFIWEVIVDHLSRNRVNAEVFAKVAYSAPVDVLKSRSDFDVIAHFRGKAYCFECKSGRLDAALAGEIVEKARQIGGVLGRFVPSVSEFRFFVVFDDGVNETDDVLSLFAGGPVEPKRIDQIRELVFNESL